MTTYINPGNNTGLYGLDDIVVNTGYGNANVESFLAVGSDTGGNVVGNIVASGNVTAAYYFGDGSQLTGLPATYGNANVSSYLASGTDTAGIVTLGNIAAANITTVGLVSATGNVTGNYILGNGSLLSGIAGTYSNANVSTYLASGTNTANIITTGNVSGTYILGNGSQLTGLPATYGNANVATLLAGFGSNAISTTGNVTAGYFIGNGSQLTGLPPVYNDANVTTLLSSFGSNSISTTGNVTASYFAGNGSLLTNINAGNIVGAYGNANVVSLLSGFGSNTISTSGNVTTGNINIGVDAVITGNLTVNGTTTTVHSNVVTIDDKFINVGNNASTSTLANGGGLGVGPAGSEYATLTFNNGTTSWNTNIGLSATGNVAGTYIIGDGSLLTNINGANVTGGYGNSNVVSLLSSFGSNTIVTTGNITGGNLEASGNITGGNIVVPNAKRIRGDFSSAATAGRTLFQTTGTGTTSFTFLGVLPGPNFLAGAANIGAGLSLYNSNDPGNTSSLSFSSLGSDSRIQSTNFGTGTVNDLTVRFGSSSTLGATFSASGGHFSAVGNVTGANINTAGAVSATGNIAGGNVIATTLLTGQQVVTTGGSGNITGANVISATTMSASATVTAGTRLLVGAGTAAAPSIAFTSDTGVDSGFYSINDGNVGVSTNGTLRVTFDNAGGVSATGNITGGNLVTAGRAVAANYTETVYGFGSATGTITPNIALGAIQTMTLTGNITLNSITSIATGESMTLILTQDATGNRTLTSSMKFAGGTKTLSTAANATDIISLFYDGSSYYASLTKGYV